MEKNTAPREHQNRMTTRGYLRGKVRRTGHRHASLSVCTCKGITGLQVDDKTLYTGKNKIYYCILENLDFFIELRYLIRFSEFGLVL